MPALGLDKAEHIFYDGFTSLPEYANFCDARNATVAVADGKDAVRSARPGTRSACTTAAPRVRRPRRRARATPNAQIPFESPHPYGNNADCT